ncbi:MAG: Rieske 2Fe-2S domain-containing protein [Pseudorhodoplanes sp.]
MRARAHEYSLRNTLYNYILNQFMRRSVPNLPTGKKISFAACSDFTSKEFDMETQQLTRVGPGTPTGSFLRQFWMPALMSSELMADGAPIRLLLLGERLIAFRTTSGKVAIMDHRCPHRCASLFYGRNEDEGLRCVYHGWKFDGDGKCIEAPNVSSRKPIHPTIPTTAYRTREVNGVVWVYMGERQTPPPFPEFPVLLEPADKVSVWCMQRECNYLQALEGDLDTSHSGFLHLGVGMGADESTKGRTSPEALSMAVPNPEFKIVDTPSGVRAGAYRPAEQSSTYWRFTNFIMPFFSQVPPCPLGSEAVLRAWVPMDDYHTMFFSITSDTFLLSRSPNARQRAIPQPGLTTDYKYLPNTTDWYGRWRSAANMSNDHLIDREMQRKQSYTGIEGLDIQDAAVTESMGPIVDHSAENLAQSDLLVVHARRKMVNAVEQWIQDKALPAPVDNPSLLGDLWSGHVIAPKGEALEIVYEKNIPSSRHVAA